MFKWFTKKREIEEIKEQTKKSFEDVKKDFLSVGEWIKHLDEEKNNQEGTIHALKEDLEHIREDIEGIKNALEFLSQTRKNYPNNNLFKTNNNLFNKQTGVEPVQTAVQTAVQTPILSIFSISEKAIIWALLNSDLKLSYEDLATMLGKEKSTIRGQINTIKSKSEGLICEKIEENGKKRVYIPEEIKEKLLKKQKVRVKNEKKKQKISEY